MNYKNSEMKIDQLINYLNKSKINLSPAFQRGHVWRVTQRKKLIKNMIEGKPIPAIFLYKEELGSMYSYNILDGKQRIESIILFIGSQRNDDLDIKNWNDYFFHAKDKKNVHFKVHYEDDEYNFKELNEKYVRNFSEYVIPTIEITLDDSCTLDEIISLFVDINQQGVAVNRFDVVKAMYKNDTILKQTFDLIAIEQKRKQDILYKIKNNDITFVMRKLTIINESDTPNSQINKMWERLLELSIFLNTKIHKKPVEVLKGFISKRSAGQYKLSKNHIRRLRKVFTLIKRAYKENQLQDSKFAKDQTHFYTMITTLLKSNLLDNFNEEDLRKRLSNFSLQLDSPKTHPNASIRKKLRTYLSLSEKHTTDITNREQRENLFYEIVSAI